jgi:Tfp pilus assembly PilM family ATPase
MPQHLVSLDIGPRHARLVTIEASFRRAELVHALTFRLEPDGDRENLMRRIRSALPAHVDSVIANADATSLSTRLIRFPFDDPRKVEAAIEFELENQVPYDIEDLAVSWSFASRGNGQAQVLAAVTPREGLAEQIDELKAVDLEPRAMVTPALALAELAPPDQQEPIAVASLGETQSHLVVVNNGIRFARTLRAGGADVDRILADRYAIDTARAKDAKEREARLVGENESASSSARQASEAVAAGLAPVVRGIVTTLKSLPAGSSPARLLVTGGLSRIPGLAGHLQERLGIPVELVDLHEALGAVECKPTGLGPEYAVALGMALALLRRGSGVALNFRRGDLAYSGDIQIYRSEVTRVAIGLATVILLFIAGSIVRYTQVSAEERQINQAFCDASKTIIGREVCDPIALLSMMKGAPDAGGGIVIPQHSATMLLDMMSRTIDTSLDVTFEDLELRVDGRLDEPERVAAKGDAATFQTTEQLVTRMKQHPCVEEAEVTKTKKNRAGRVDFNLSARVRCPPGTEITAPLAVAEAAPDEAPPKEAP